MFNEFLLTFISDDALHKTALGNNEERRKGIKIKKTSATLKMSDLFKNKPDAEFFGNTRVFVEQARRRINTPGKIKGGRSGRHGARDKNDTAIIPAKRHAAGVRWVISAG